MEYFKVCNESKFDDVYYLFSYYAINGKAICLTISKDNLTNELNFEDNFANFETIKSFTEDTDSTTIYFDTDYDLFNEMSSFIKQQYKGFIVQFFAWKSATEQNPPILVVKLPTTFLLYEPKTKDFCKHQINEPIDFEHDYCKKYYNAKDALSDIVFKSYKDVLDKI